MFYTESKLYTQSDTIFLLIMRILYIYTVAHWVMRIVASEAMWEIAVSTVEAEN